THPILSLSLPFRGKTKKVGPCKEGSEPPRDGAAAAASLLQ
uniref:Uncharacterized protein n=1 Tax=Aegilops tauschii subsp. strangulata TaxID=200361 RepID=A0A452Y420_AEGTS